MTMKTKILLILLAFLPWTSVLAQKHGHFHDPEKQKEFREFKMKFVAQEMSLAENQKEKFFELYSAMMDEREKAMREGFMAKKKVESMKSASEADYKEASEAMSESRAKVAQIEKKYDEKFSRFLSQKQIFLMKEAENKFRETLSQMRKGKNKSKNKK